ncbi:insulinase family protein [Catellatospora sichuanensis]|uniref:insulinase family protein n=1 Tax=Catellatospora sichuanensis TaxID=1969805 RepID=UPI001182808C|nr:insulinase family protein [Catellatospora sichuanensis]
MRRAEIDTVRVLWQELPGDFTATLAFAVGARDEDVDQLGITHLATRHLLLSLLAEPDETAGLLETSFTLSGDPDQVAEDLDDLATLVANPDLGGLVLTARQLDTADRATELDLDVDDAVRDPWGSLLARRLGPTGPGLLRWPVVDPRRLTADEVRAHLARWFTAGNAVLTCTGPPPAGLRLPLPAGPRAAHATCPVRGTAGPAWYADEVVAPGIAVGATAGPHAFLLLRVLGTRVDAALEQAAVKAWSTEWSTPVGDDRLELGLSLHLRGKTRQRDSATAARILWQELRRLATEEPAPAELDAVVTRYTRPPAEDPQLRGQLDRLGVLAAAEQAHAQAPLADAGHRELFDVYDEFGEAQVAAAARLAPADVRAAAASWLPSALLVVPIGVDAALDGMTRTGCPVGSFTPQGELLRPSLARRLRGAKDGLVLGHDACHLVAADGTVHTFPMDDVMLVQRRGETLLGNLRHGCLVDVSGFTGVDKLVTWVPPRRHRIAYD